MDERRRHVRFKSTTIVQYNEGFFKAKGESITKDLSLAGLCFFSEKKLKVGQVVRMKIYYDDKSPAKILKAKVMWSKPSKGDVCRGYLNGLSFVR